MGVCWWTAMNAVIEHGMPLVDDATASAPSASSASTKITYLSATPSHPTVYVQPGWSSWRPSPRWHRPDRGELGC
jgi:hypothetical protein